MWAPHSGLQKPRVRTSLFPETFLPVTGLPGFQLYPRGECDKQIQELASGVQEQAP